MPIIIMKIRQGSRDIEDKVDIEMRDENDTEREERIEKVLFDFLRR